MNRVATYALIALSCAPASVLAEACVTDNFDQPVPGAEAAIQRFADVPSARFPSVWQEGVLAGHAYKVFPDGLGVLASDFERPNWKIDINCTEETGTCTYKNSGDVPADAPDVARVLGTCLLGKAEAKDAPVVPMVSEQEVAPETSDCVAAKVPDGGTIITLQRLLAVADGDPGPIDGLIGPSTRNALRLFLGADNVPDDLEQAVKEVRRKICASS